VLDSALRAVALATTGFMPEDEGDALFDAAMLAGAACPGLPMVEIGSYCGRSTVWFGAAARACNTVLHAVDHHVGSEENQPGWEWHDASLVDPASGRINTLPHFTRTIDAAGLAKWVRTVVGNSPEIAASWLEHIAMCFIDGGHGREVARNDYVSWAPHIAMSGILAIHDVFTDPDLGGQAPFEEIYLPAIASGQFADVSATGSLRILRRV
jgi:predicted O-methyltransferase YrrM